MKIDDAAAQCRSVVQQRLAELAKRAQSSSRFPDPRLDNQPCAVTPMHEVRPSLIQHLAAAVEGGSPSEHQKHLMDVLDGHSLAPSDQRAHTSRVPTKAPARAVARPVRNADKGASLLKRSPAPTIATSMKFSARHDVASAASKRSGDPRPHRSDGPTSRRVAGDRPSQQAAGNLRAQKLAFIRSLNRELFNESSNGAAAPAIDGKMRTPKVTPDRLGPLLQRVAALLNEGGLPTEHDQSLMDALDGHPSTSFSRHKRTNHHITDGRARVGGRPATLTERLADFGKAVPPLNLQGDPRFECPDWRLPLVPDLRHPPTSTICADNQFLRNTLFPFPPCTGDDCQHELRNRLTVEDVAGLLAERVRALNPKTRQLLTAEIRAHIETYKEGIAQYRYAFGDLAPLPYLTDSLLEDVLYALFNSVQAMYPPQPRRAPAAVEPGAEKR